jgi:hypothetical protein
VRNLNSKIRRRMKRVTINILFIFCSFISSFSQAIGDSKLLKQENEKFERKKRIGRVVRAAVGVVVFTLFEVPAIPIVAAFAISEIIADTNQNKQTDEK